LRNDDLDLRLDWHRQFNANVPRKIRIPTKPLNLLALKEAIEYYYKNLINDKKRLQASQEPLEQDNRGAMEEDYSDEEPDG